MEPRTIEKPVQSRAEGQTAPPRPPDRKRRFQLVKLEERIAPCGIDHTRCCVSHKGANGICLG
jgi:hypothetical protein